MGTLSTDRSPPPPTDRRTAPDLGGPALSVPALTGGGSVLAVLSSALDGLSLRQQVIADNIANVDTPDFRATGVEFESSLREAIADGDDPQIAAQLVPTVTPVGANGNNVDLRKETMAATQTQFQYQLMTRAVTDQYSLVKTVAGSM
ncbi:flagellar biosynthesis protein FlgB [Nocardioides sp. YIM 123512]|uniref:Flagellar biosynthesis protein FlgB n=1 Tax=Nocardioides flavescens TaxID=2691959 RepID=A0A6L7EL04_9ACTN|nr:flagellar biosynthesis protein FlgB [Nocardioides flavescens]